MGGILLTGATGFVGRALCARLRASSGMVRAAVREYPADARDTAAASVSNDTIAVGDIGGNAFAARVGRESA